MNFVKRYFNLCPPTAKTKTTDSSHSFFPMTATIEMNRGINMNNLSRRNVEFSSELTVDLTARRVQSCQVGIGSFLVVGCQQERITDACFIPVGYICIIIGNLGSKMNQIKFKSTVIARYRCLRLTERSVLLCERPIIFRKLPLPQIDIQETSMRACTDTTAW